MYSLRYDTHRWTLSSLTSQRHIRYQLFAEILNCYIILGMRSGTVWLVNVYLAL